MEVDPVNQHNNNNANEEKSENQKEMPLNPLKKEKSKKCKVRLTRVIKENHSYSILDAEWCPFPEGIHYVATVGANQVNVYDMQRRGNFMGTIINYRNWNEKKRESQLPDIVKNEKLFLSVCWMRRWRDLWVVASDVKQQIHCISVVHHKCVKMLKTDLNIIKMKSHPIYPNILVTINQNHICQFWNIGTGQVVFRLNTKINNIQFSPSGNNFSVITMDGKIKEFSQKVICQKEDDAKNNDEMNMDMDMDVDNDEDQDIDMVDNNNNNNNNNVVVDHKKKQKKEFMITEINSMNIERNGKKIIELKYKNEEILVVCNRLSEFRLIDISNTKILHSWKMSSSSNLKLSDDLDEDDSWNTNVCKFDLNLDKTLVSYINNGLIYIYDMDNFQYIQRLKLPKRQFHNIGIVIFDKYFVESLLMIADNMLIKFDRDIVVKKYFPSTSDFKYQFDESENRKKPLFKDIHIINFD